MALFPHDIDPPLMVFSALPLALFAFKIAEAVAPLQHPGGRQLRARPWPRRLRAWPLATPSACAVLSGLLTRDQPFFRTPKRAQSTRCCRPWPTAARRP